MYIIVTYFSVSVKLYLDDASSKSIEGCYNDSSVTMVYKAGYTSIRGLVKVYNRQKNILVTIILGPDRILKVFILLFLW